MLQILINTHSLKGNTLKKAKDEMVESLNSFANTHFIITSYEEDFHRTEIETLSKSEFELSWKGFIGSTDYREDGTIEFGVFLFPFIGERRVKAFKGKEYDYAFRYIWLKQDGEWHDHGWEIDEHYEFEHWYIKGTS